MKLQKSNIRKIDLSQINMTENIRKQYDSSHIKELAESIETHGQLQPIGVTEQEDKTFNIIYGFCRFKAFQLLVSQEKDFNQIFAVIIRGDPVTLQLIENIHRKDLTSSEFEDALYHFIEQGLSQKEISEKLHIRLTRISDALAARKIRLNLEEKGIDTSEMSTSAISALRKVPDEKKEEVTKKAKEKGATVKAVKEEVEKVKQENDEIKKQSSERANRKPPDTKPEIETSEDKEEAAYTYIDFTDFMKLPEVIAIINKNNYMLQWKCTHCGEDVK